MSNLRAAAQQALKTIESWSPSLRTNDDEAAINALRAALEQEEQQEQEPFGYIWPTGRHPEFRYTQQMRDGVAGMPLYTHPPRRELEELVTRRSALAALNHLSMHNGPGRLKEATKMLVHPPRREWQGLTENELGELMRDSCGYSMWVSPDTDALKFSRAIEAKLKERNHE